MNEGDFRSGIRKTWEYAKCIGIEGEFSGPSTLNASEEFKAISLDPNMDYERIYLGGMRGGDYNIMLADYSFFQFSYGDQFDIRYAYYPNPFLGASRDAIASIAEMHEYVEEGIIDIDEFLHKISETKQGRCAPLVRYEYARAQYVPLRHPSSHLHLGHHTESRWAVRRVLSPDAFGLLVMKLFYGDYWENADLVKSKDPPTTVDTELALAKTACQLLPREEFSEAEESQFFWA